MTEAQVSSHVKAMMGAAASLAEAPKATPIGPPSFSELYDEHFAFIWRSVRRLGVAEASVDDVVQDVFVIAYRKLDTFEGRSSIRTWLFGIARRVVSDHRRASSRRRPHTPISDSLCANGRTPQEAAARLEAAKFLHGFLGALSDEQREVFVLAELEQLTAPEIAEATECKLNTVYSRLRLARKSFERAVERYHARDRGSASAPDGASETTSSAPASRTAVVGNTKDERNE